jgi:F-type H+-transporting ATPase subunit delta
MATPPQQPAPVAPKLHPTVFDTSAVQIARMYATALYDAATKGNQVEPVLEEYGSFVRDVLDRNPDFERALYSAVIARGNKADLLRRIMERHASTIFLNYLLVLNDHARLNLLRPALRELEAMHDQRLGRVRVEVRTAAPVDGELTRALQERLRALIGGQPVIHSEVDPSLLAGMVIRVGDMVYDGSAKIRLQKWRKQLAQRLTHEIQSRRDQFSNSA